MEIYSFKNRKNIGSQEKNISKNGVVGALLP